MTKGSRANKEEEISLVVASAFFGPLILFLYYLFATYAFTTTRKTANIKHLKCSFQISKLKYFPPFSNVINRFLEIQQ